MIDAVLLLVYLAGSAFFSGMETGAVSVNKLRLQHLLRKRYPGARLLKRFHEEPEYLLGTTLVGTNLCNTAFTAAATGLLVGMLGQSLGSSVAVVLCTAVVLVFGEYLPKAWFQSHPAPRTLRFVGLLDLFGRLFRLVTVCLTWLTEHVIPAKSTDYKEAFALTRDELQYMLAQDESAAASFPEQKARLIHEVFQLSTRSCGELMVPRDSMKVIESGTSIREAVRMSRGGAITRFPVYDRGNDHFVGILNMLDLMEKIDQVDDMVLTDHLRPPVFVDEDMPADELIPRLRRSRQPLLLVRNRQGQVVGCITVEVVLAELVKHLR